MSERQRDPHQNQPAYMSGQPLEQAHIAVILLHGRGGSAADMLGLAHEIDLPGISYLAPEALHQTWYPYRFLEPPSKNEPYLSSALGIVERTVEHALQSGIPMERIVLGGFSQGACLALGFVARHPGKYGGILGLSGGLIGDNLQDNGYSGDFVQTPVLLGCSDRDPHIPLQRVQESADILQSMQASVDLRIYPRMGHTINADELQAVRSLLQAIPIPHKD